jgi:hypothetical protein
MSGDEENQERINMPDSDSSVNLWMRANTYMVQGTYKFVHILNFIVIVCIYLYIF